MEVLIGQSLINGPFFIAAGDGLPPRGASGRGHLWPMPLHEVFPTKIPAGSHRRRKIKRILIRCPIKKVKNDCHWTNGPSQSPVYPVPLGCFQPACSPLLCFMRFASCAPGGGPLFVYGYCEPSNVYRPLGPPRVQRGGCHGHKCAASHSPLLHFAAAVLRRAATAGVLLAWVRSW